MSSFKVSRGTLLTRRALPLDMKVEMTISRVRQWYNHWGGDVFVSFSGGKDSTVLLHIVRSIYPEIEGVFCDTGVEFPEIRDFVRTWDNILILWPKKKFAEILEKYGYPVVSKKVCQYAREAKPSGRNQATVRLRLTGIRPNGSFSKLSRLSLKWQKLIDAPFKVSEKCCDWLKKKPFREYEKESGRKPITGMMAAESQNRELIYMRLGCNWFDTKHPQSHPMIFWTEQDVLRYIVQHEIPIFSVYGDIVENQNGDLVTTGQHRTGCIYCAFGIHLEKPNRYQLLYKSHPKLWNYAINKLGFGPVLDFIGVDYYPENLLFEEPNHAVQKRTHRTD